MPRFNQQGCALICDALKELGIDTVFGIPGTQSIPLFEAMRRSSLKVILPTNELAGAFMANGYYRVSEQPAALVTIQGPGFTYAITGLAEARHDSVALLHIVVTDNWPSGKAFCLQQIDHAAMAAHVVKQVFNINHVDDLLSTLRDAYNTATAGEAGPVLVLLSKAVLTQTINGGAGDEKMAPAAATVDSAAVERVARRLAQSSRVVLFIGQGTKMASDMVLDLVKLLDAMVVTTCSGRGVVAEDDDHVFDCDFSLGFVDAVNALFDSCDLVLAIGCKFSHNGTAGFKLKIDADKLIHVDASSGSLGVNYPASMTVEADAGCFLNALLAARDIYTARVDGFDSAERMRLKKQVALQKRTIFKTEPVLEDVKPSDLESFFHLICKRCKPATIFVTDAGLHQSLARNYLSIRRPRGLIVPADYQSMGFGLPAAIGAGIHSPSSPIVAIIGDGGLAMSAMEMGTAVTAGIDLAIVLFNNACLGAIRNIQLREYGEPYCTVLNNPDYRALSKSLGAAYFRVEGENWRGSVDAFFQADSVRLLEICLRDSGRFKSNRHLSKMQCLLYESRLYDAAKKIHDLF